MALRVPESKFWDHFYRPKPPPKPPFRPSRNPNRTSKSDFWPFYWFLPFSHWNSHCNRKKLRTAEGVVLQQKQKVFRNLWTKWNNLKPCRNWNAKFHQNKNHPIVMFIIVCGKRGSAKKWQIHTQWSHFWRLVVTVDFDDVSLENYGQLII